MPTINSLVRIDSNTHIVNGASTTNYSNSALFNVATYDQKSAVKSYTPNFWKLKNSGVRLPVNPYSLRAIKGSRFHIYSGIMIGQYMNYREKIAFDAILPDLPLLSETEILAKVDGVLTSTVIDAKALFANHVQNVVWQAGQDIGEMKSTSDLLLRRAKQIASFATDFRRSKQAFLRSIKSTLRKGGKASIRRVISELNSMYLEWQFGWKPLMGSMADIHTLIVNKINETHPREKVGGIKTNSLRVVKSVLNQRVYSTSEILTPPYMTVSYDIVHEFTVRVKVSGLLKEPKKLSYMKMAGLGVDNIIPTMWELLTCSFIVDYFVNVGDWIGNLRSTTPQMDMPTMCQTTKIVCNTWAENFKIKISVPGPFTYTVTTHSGVSDVLQTVLFNRVPMSETDLHVDLKLENPSWNQVFNTLSVAAQLFKLFK